ncbi:restriction endonuclease subunit S [uncultured Megasphaera sp.]|uniref:restriction endonuclease subunit S n=1 Tax=uncultured Megasphaera sp. TaxID=165188 RepID=UPI00260FF963|nr:restriction endonuclease subunit S [uncultured Megasphaera sp.]
MMMGKIDTSLWKKIKLTSIFNMSNTKSIVQKDICPESGNIPYVTASSENNGVLTYISCPDEWTDKGNCIMIGGKTMTFTYQETDFCSNDSHNIALYLKDKTQATKLHYLFLISALRASLSQRYSWNDSISMKRIKSEDFYIPVTPDGFPDWAYMDSFMAEIMKESEICLENLRIVLKI